MNRVLSIIILLLWSSIIRSQPVTEQEALEAVTSFLNTRDFHGTKLRDGRLNGSPHLSFSSSQLYAFDTGDRFILAGADRRLPSILGYSDHGTFNEAYTKSDCFRKMVRSLIQEKNPNFHIYKPSNFDPLTDRRLFSEDIFRLERTQAVQLPVSTKRRHIMCDRMRSRLHVGGNVLLPLPCAWDRKL